MGDVREGKDQSLFQTPGLCHLQSCQDQELLEVPQSLKGVFGLTMASPGRETGVHILTLFPQFYFFQVFFLGVFYFVNCLCLEWDIEILARRLQGVASSAAA